VTPPGWYPDPEGGGLECYWDGRQWTDAFRVPPKSSGGKVVGALIALSILVVAFAVLLAVTGGGGSGGNYSTADIEAGVIDTCHDAVKKGLRDPDSARFDEWRVWQGGSAPAGMSYNPGAGDKIYSASGSVNAKNGFGGYAGSSPYTCIAVVTSEGNINARAREDAGLSSP